MENLVDKLYTHRDNLKVLWEILLNVSEDEALFLINEAEQIEDEIKQDVIFNIIGHMYYYGLGVETNYRKAKNYLERAMRSNSQALTNLGDMYYEGKGVPQDYQKARELYEKGVSLNNSWAMSALGYMYHCGTGVEKNFQKAKELYERAVLLNNSQAMINLGYMYHEGEGVEKDYHKAKELYEQAVLLNDPMAMNNLGRMYQEGQGVSPDFQKAKEFFEQAVRYKNRPAMANLAYMYYNGFGGEKDLEKALDLFLQCYKSPEIFQDVLPLLKTILSESDSLLTRCIYRCGEWFSLKEKVAHLQREVELLRAQLKYRPGGEGYYETAKHWESLLRYQKTQSETERTVSSEDTPNMIEHFFS